jgi:ParB-like chromosome segregation protein Spo0J
MTTPITVTVHRMKRVRTEMVTNMETLKSTSMSRGGLVKMATIDTVIGTASGREIERFKNYFDGSGGDTGFISVNDIYVMPGFNARNFNLPENRKHLDNLKVQIAAHGGTHTPIKVAFDNGTKRVELIGGESRYRAVKELNAEAGEEKYLILAMAVARSKVATAADRTELSLSDNSGKPFSQWEVGSDYEKLVTAGRSIEYIAKRFNISDRYVRDAIDLVPAADEIKVALSNGDITVAVALKAIRNKGSQAAAVIQQQITAAKASGTGKVVAQYTKRAQVTKVPNELILDLHKTLNKYGDKTLVKLAQRLEEFLPIDRSQGNAAKDLDTF